jgi:hypothetical protein
MNAATVPSGEAHGRSLVSPRVGGKILGGIWNFARKRRAGEREAALSK